MPEETKSPKPADLDNRKKALDLALAQIEKQFGKGSIMKLDGNIKTSIDVIPSGCLSLDRALGVGGMPKGRIVEVYGPESSGKTTLTLSVTAQCQKAGGTAAFIDAEHAFDASYAKTVGVKLDDLLMSQPDTGEQALEIAETLVRSNAVDLIIIDSVAALTPRAEIEGDMGASHMGLQARLMSQALRKLTAAISKSNTCIIFINQIRMKIGVMFGSPETTTGGRALKFYSSVRIDVRRIESLKKGDQFIGNRVRAKIVKNKVAAPFCEAEFEIHFSEGISRTADILDLSVKQGIVEKAGAWFSYEGEKIGQGKENSRLFLKDNPKLLSKIEKQLRAKLNEETNKA